MPASDIFAAVANPVRRQILELLHQRPLRAGEIAAHFDLNRPAISEHLQVLRNVGLVSDEIRGRERLYHLNGAPLQALQVWLAPFETYWRQRMQSLSAALDSGELNMTEPVTISLSQYIAHSPAKVWAALTTPELIAKWWAPGDVRPILGHQFILDMGEWGKQPCTVVTVEANHVFAYRYAPEMLDSTITWRVEAEGTGTRLHLDHTFHNPDLPMAKMAITGMGNGWPTVMGRIEPALSSVSV
jgi:uncharacterized protein YndB with AHSA1/START domain/DNA-binding transcriptional ArsR family regulator